MPLPEIACFNSATALQPWKHGERMDNRSVDIASIRPRLFSRGNSTIRWTVSVRSSTRFNSATALQPWKPGRLFGRYRRRYASIRPRLFSRGNSVPIPSLPTSCSASIRPRLFSRGNTVSPEPHPAYSRRFNSATALQPWKQRVGLGPRRSARASIRPRLFSRGNHRRSNWTSGRMRCFNSATALQPWKLAILTLFARWRRCFNSATALQPWKQRQAAAPAPRPSGFNSATALQPWKHAVFPLSHLKSGHSLQFGHGSSAVETADGIAQGWLVPVASIRPRLFSRGNVMLVRPLRSWA